jgi:hypothetical protein
MFLSKRDGIWTLFFTDETGKRRKCSTGEHTKPEALAFVKRFDAQERERKRTLKLSLRIPGAR